MKLVRLANYVILIFMFSCASTHPGKEGMSLKNNVNLPMVVSAKTIERSTAENESFQLIEVTLENSSEEWLKINNSRVVISNPAVSKLSVVLGTDLKDWGQAMQLRLKKDQYNKELVQLGLVTLGSIVAQAGSNNDNATLAGLGAATVFGTYSWAVGDVIRYSYNSATQSKKVPENHLYHSFSIPGKMFLRRWVLINKPVRSIIETLVLELETVDGERDVFEIKI